jgi:hypothetical protein
MLAEDQRAFLEKQTQIPIATQTINGFYVQTSVVQRGDLFKVGLILVNHTDHTIPVEQEKFFLLNAYDRTLYRFPDYEVSAGWARLAHMRPPPPPPPRRYYTIEPSGSSNYTVLDLGSGYYSVSGFSPSYRVEEHYDYAETLGYIIGSRIRHALDARKARQQIEALDRYYFRDIQLAPGQQAVGMIFFQPIGNSSRTPVKLILFIENTKFEFSFGE